MTISKAEITSIIDWLDGKFKDGSPPNSKARRALANALRYEPRDQGLMFTLADLIDPDRREDMGRWLMLKRPPGRTKSVNERNIAAVVWARIQAGDKKEAALQHAVDTKRVGMTAVKTAYRKWEKHFRANGKKLKGLTRITD